MGREVWHNEQLAEHRLIRQQALRSNPKDFGYPNQGVKWNALPAGLQICDRGASHVQRAGELSLSELGPGFRARITYPPTHFGVEACDGTIKIGHLRP